MVRIKTVKRNGKKHLKVEGLSKRQKRLLVQVGGPLSILAGGAVLMPYSSIPLLGEMLIALGASGASAGVSLDVARNLDRKRGKKKRLKKVM